MAARRKSAPKTKQVRIVQIYDGAWYALGAFEQDICCDCGLAHTTEYKLENGRLFFRATRDEKTTVQHRKEHGITVKRKS